VILVLVSLGTTTFAQKKARLSLVKYAQSDGLSSYNVRQILKDSKGFLWVASQDGLARFDGKTFRPYTKQSIPKYRISGPDVRKLIEDSLHKALWVLPNREQLNIISTTTGAVIKNVNIRSYSNTDWNITMAACGDNLWIGSFCGLKILNTKNWEAIPPGRIKNSLTKAISASEINCIAKDHFNNVWVCYTGYGIVIYNGTNFNEIAQIKLKGLNDYLGSGNIRINDFSFISDSEVLFATDQGLRKISFTKKYSLTTDNNPVKYLNSLNTCQINAIKMIGQNRIMISGNGHLYEFDLALRSYIVYDESIGEAESRWINYVQEIYCDGNKIWLSCQQGVAMMNVNKSPFVKYYYDEKTGNKIEHMRSICVLPGGDVLCGLSSGLILVNHSDDSFTVLDKLHLYHHLFFDRRGSIFLFRDDGIYTLKKEAIKPVTTMYPEFNRYKTYPINSHVFLADSAIILGTENDKGVLCWNYRRHYVKRIDTSSTPALASNTVNNIYLDKNGNLWVLSDKVITIIDNSFKTTKSPEISPGSTSPGLDLFFDMCEARGKYWIASYGNGIIELDNKLKVQKLISQKDGLSNDGVYNIFNVGDSSLLITSNNGLSFYNIKKPHFKNYYGESGLQSNSFEEVTAEAWHNKIYAGGINGFSVVNTSKLAENKTPPIFYFNGIDIKLNNGEEIVNTDLDVKKITVPGNWLQTSISFTGINFISPRRVTYKYRINEINKDWIDNGYLNQINIVGLPPGTYTIEAEAANEDGYRANSKTLIVEIEPKWYQTWWFKFLVVAIIAAILYAIYRYRIKQIKIQQQIRRDIANDLHDDLGSNLNSIKIFTHLAIEEKQNTNYLGEIEKLITNTAAGLRDMLWVLEGAQDNVNELAERIKKFAVPLADASQIQIECTVEPAIVNMQISKIEKRNLLLIAKEAINNSFKYASCKTIKIIIKQVGGNKLSLSITDDGAGFDVNGKSGGYGLNNMKYRADQINYLFYCKSSPGKGTAITIEKR